MKSPLISVIIVHYNNKEFLDNCIPSLLKQTYHNFEIILVDNGSTDDSVSYIKKKFPKIKLIENKENSGFAEGNNIGYKHAKGKYIVFLNNDTYVEKNYLTEFLKVFDSNEKIGIAQSKIILTDNRGIDTCGSFWTDTSFLYYVGNYKDPKDPKYNKPFPIFAAKGASVIVKREVIEKVGLFDPDFWSYYEETDFCHRAWIAGYETWYWPNAVCYHEMGGTSLTFKNDFIQFHNFKNKLCSYIKILQPFELLKVIVLFLLLNIGISVLWLVQGKLKHSISLVKSVLWNIFNLKSILDKRRKVQSTRKKSDAQIWTLVKKNPSFTYYKYLFNDNLGAYEDK